MDFEFWDNCWHKDSQPFHVSRVHPLLKTTLPLLDPYSPVLVPLSGKSLDLIYLSEQGYASTAIEFNPKAVTEFITSSGIAFSKTATDDTTVYNSDNIELWLADFFAVTTSDIGQFEQVFDRAAYIALPETMRADYAKHLISLLKSNAQIFMVTMDYPQHQMSGPPFYVDQQELAEHFAGAKISEKARHSLMDNHPRWKELGLDYLDEVLYQIQFVSSA
ncbi:thiopurine S-methyltransferase [Kangiella sp. TOML190]|uniref:thiopurine S-methyltransferase n=1 Tax=Kangiella sp. TOML190 TaxID=2931351 RepID=UPI00203B7BF9|nr:thiopurine S-methyltransferase [Kangiella sp. TOML190]